MTNQEPTDPAIINAVFQQKIEILKFLQTFVVSGETMAKFGSEHGSLVRFEVQLQAGNRLVFNHFFVCESLRRNRLTAFILACAEAFKGIEVIGVKSVTNVDLRAFLKRKGFQCYADHDFLKRLEVETIPSEVLPDELAIAVKQFRTDWVFIDWEKEKISKSRLLNLMTLAFKHFFRFG